MTLHVFVGPTIPHSEVLSRVASARVHNPVAHGDLLRVKADEGDTILLIDGVFHQKAAVRHKEILSLLARGVRVIGCSSIGALRAAELAPYGMLGIGYVYEAYARGDIEADDEVAVIHEAGGDWRPLSEALVNLKHLGDVAVRQGILSSDLCAQAIALAAARQYRERTWSALRRDAEVSQHLTVAVEQLWNLSQSQPDAANVKLADARAALDHVAQGEQVPACSAFDLAADPGWQTLYLAQWRARYEGGLASPLSVIQWRQIYDPMFLQLWQKTVHQIVSAAHESSYSSALALSSLEQMGMFPARSSGLGPLDFVCEETKSLFACADAAKTVGAWEAVYEDLCRRMGHDPGANLAIATLDQHLSEVWACSADRETLEQAARDRGFLRLDQAYEASRHFIFGYLRARAGHAARSGRR
ncbi:TfuA-like protein [Nonomuraea fuscirosea]|uniref:TfuA-like protein n=1 Tax=Nonomuraea fuscirosea TaxID=1291556 RepID=UPI0034384C27